jgi:hypothetical protein
VRELSDRILPSLKFSPNELFLGLVVNSHHDGNLEGLVESMSADAMLHLAYVEQQQLDGYSLVVEHAARWKAVFDAKVLGRTPHEVIFGTGDLVQVYRSDLVHTYSAAKKLQPMWSVPRRIASRERSSYRLESLEGVPLVGLFNAQRLRAFVPRDGTRLYLDEIARTNGVGGVEHSGAMPLGVSGR